jgi:hypothetical protein
MLSIHERLLAISNECHGGIGTKTIEPDRAGRLLKDLCGIVAEQENRLAVLEDRAAEVVGPSSGPDQVEARARTDSDVQRKGRR